MAPTQPDRKGYTMLQIYDLSEYEALKALAAITDTAASIAYRLRRIDSDLITEKQFRDLDDISYKYFQVFHHYCYEDINLETAADVHQEVREYKYLHELY